MAVFSGLGPRLGMVLLEQRLHLFPWSPVCLGTGIGLYFLLKFEPGWLFYLGIAILSLSCLILAIRWGPEISPLFWALSLIGAGIILAGVRSHAVNSPVLPWRYYGPIQGRVIEVDRSGSDAARLTLDQVVLSNMASDLTPERVRVTLHGDWNMPVPTPGEVVLMTGHLAPPAGAVEPGGFDFRRHAYFKRLGGVGYTRAPVVLWAEDQGELPIGSWRAALSERVRSAIQGDAGAFAAAVTTGDRSGMRQPTLEALRASNLAHLLAISGLHMGLLAGVVFAAGRLAFALVPVIGLRVPAKKISAAVALAAAGAYLLLSGGNVATERAFIMVAVMLVALILDRRAISLRAVAVAAVVVLLVRPEALLGPGFQMSFAATTALIAVFSWIRDSQIKLGYRWMRPIVALFISSAVAGAATAPFGAAHFNQLSQLGLLANLLSVPLMGTVVIPAAVLAACLVPFGAEAIPLWIMGQGLGWILWVAKWVSGMEGATRLVHSPHWIVLPLFTLGALLAVLWVGRLRWIGVGPCILSLVVWATTVRPYLLIDESGALLGLMTQDGRALNKPKGQGFAARSWLENDGIMTDQEAAAGLWPTAPEVGGYKLRTVAGAAAETAKCSPSELLVSSSPLPDALPCLVMDRGFFRHYGAVAIHVTQDGPVITTQRSVTGCRLWSACKH